MMLRLPYCEQKMAYDCGPAALKMILGYYGRRTSLKRLTRLLKSSPTTGTTRRAMAPAARRFGLAVRARCGITLGELEAAIRECRPVLIEYRNPSTGNPHYSVVIGFAPGSVILHDPHNGPGFRVSEKDFRLRWRGRCREKYLHWGLFVGE